MREKGKPDDIVPLHPTTRVDSSTSGLFFPIVRQKSLFLSVFELGLLLSAAEMMTRALNVAQLI